MAFPDPDGAEQPSVKKESKKDMTIIDVHDTKGTHFVQYDQVYNSSSATKPVVLFMLLFLAVLCSLL